MRHAQSWVIKRIHWVGFVELKGLLAVQNNPVFILTSYKHKGIDLVISKKNKTMIATQIINIQQ